MVYPNVRIIKGDDNMKWEFTLVDGSITVIDGGKDADFRSLQSVMKILELRQWIGISESEGIRTSTVMKIRQIQ
jgi:hypothetical protein